MVLIQDVLKLNNKDCKATWAYFIESKSCCHNSLNFLGAPLCLHAMICRAEQTKHREMAGQTPKPSGRGAEGEDEQPVPPAVPAAQDTHPSELLLCLLAIPGGN